MKNRKIIFLAVAAVVAILAVAGNSVWKKYYDKKVPNFSRTVEFYVYPGMTAGEVAEYVADSCGARSSSSVRRAFESEAGDRVLPGHYTIMSSNTSVYVARMVSHGWQTPVKLVLSGTMRLQSGLARKIGNQMMLDSADVINALRDSALIASFGFDRKDVFALFIPDTYEIYWTESMKEVLTRQKAAYDAFWTDANKEKARLQGLSMIEVSILASIVNGETNYEPEMPAIAGVYLNRLRKGMLLQADPTVAYCFDYEPARILKKHLEVDSPFNTYKHAGLPPAPICVPSRAALEAVLNPDRHGYIYFCASPDFNGTHRFAVTLTEHLRNAREFQRALNAIPRP